MKKQFWQEAKDTFIGSLKLFLILCGGGLIILLMLPLTDYNESIIWMLRYYGILAAFVFIFNFIAHIIEYTKPNKKKKKDT